MLFTEATGRKVVSTTTAETVGKIDRFLVDPESRYVVAVHVKKNSTGDTLYWSDIASFGNDAVTVAGADKIVAEGENLAPLTGKTKLILGKRVLATNGDEIGKVTDVDFDAQSGQIVELHLDAGRVQGERLVGVGSWAVVVRAQVPQL